MSTLAWVSEPEGCRFRPGSRIFSSSELARWVKLSDDQICSPLPALSALERWNKKMNLTSVQPGKETVLRHYCESLFFGSHLASESIDSIADIGSGAGFPGVPIAILKPECNVTLVESNQRKAVFLGKQREI